MKLETNRHWAIIGFTGSGKTTFSTALMRLVLIEGNGNLPIYILDSKGQGDFKPFYKIAKRHYGNIVPPRQWWTRERPVMIWQPESDDLNLYDMWFKQIYMQRSPCIVYIDEVSSITTVGGKPPRYYDILQKQGRGLGIGVVSLTQSPSYIPPMMLRLATYWVRFTLNDEYDIAKVARVMGRAVLTPPPDEHGFWFRDTRKPVAYSPPMYFKDFQEFFR